MSMAFGEQNSTWRKEQKFSSNKNSIPQSYSLSESIRNASGNRNSQYYTKTTVHQRAPILFSTNRGLYLRVTNQPLRTNDSEVVTQNDTVEKNNYNIKFCDLERWSTNKANTVSLEDTLTSFYPHKMPQLPVITNAASRCESNHMRSVHCSFKTAKDCNRLFNSTFSRFEE